VDPQDPSIVADVIHDSSADNAALLPDFNAGTAEGAPVINTSMCHVSAPILKVRPR
jgi:hypothetical protein